MWKTILKVVLAVVAVASVGGVAVLALLSFFSRPPQGLGVHDGRLAPCPDSPNCVCSQCDDPEHHVEPLRIEGPPGEAWTRLREALTARPRTVIVAEEGDYLRAECTSRIFRFVDDVEFLLDREAGVIHVRSASRAGHSDLGVNRERVEEIRAALAH
jgi:uncharacterized protein (DUF1499 family)